MGAPADIAQVTDSFNRSQVSWLADLVERSLEPGNRAGILGLTYKPDTDVIEQAAGLLLAEELCARGHLPVVAYDPSGEGNLLACMKGAIRFADSAVACISEADTVVLAGRPGRPLRRLPATNGRAANGRAWLSIAGERCHFWVTSRGCCTCRSAGGNSSAFRRGNWCPSDFEPDPRAHLFARPKLRNIIPSRQRKAIAGQVWIVSTGLLQKRRIVGDWLFQRVFSKP